MPSSRPTVKRPVPAQPARSQQSVSKPVSSERPIPQFSISEVNRASAVAQSNSFAAKSNSIASQSNGVPTAQARNPPPLPPSAAPPEPKKNLFKVLYDYDGTRSKGYEIFKDEILESMGNEKLGGFAYICCIITLLISSRLVQRKATGGRQGRLGPDRLSRDLQPSRSRPCSSTTSSYPSHPPRSPTTASTANKRPLQIQLNAVSRARRQSKSNATITAQATGRQREEACPTAYAERQCGEYGYE